MCARSVDLLKALKAYATGSTRVAMSGGEQLQSGYIRHKTGHTHTEQYFYTYVAHKLGYRQANYQYRTACKIHIEE